MTQIGYSLSSEEHKPNDLVRYAQRAEEVGFPFALISDHFHPWIDKQGQSPFAWTVIGAIAHATKRLHLGTGVTCPTVRYHPALVAQMAATAAVMMPGRFFLGLGTGENLNEHVFGDRWPAYEMRTEMFAEAIDVIRLMWEGGMQTFYGMYYTVENAQIFTLPDELPQIYIAAGGPNSAALAGELGDGLISTAPLKEIVDTFDSSGDGSSRPHYGQLTVCVAETEEKARKIAYEYWPNAGLHGEISQELPTPTHFEQAAESVSEQEVAKMIICGPDAGKHREQIDEFVEAGYDHIYVHQVGPDQDAFFNMYQRDILPHYS